MSSPFNRRTDRIMASMRIHRIDVCIWFNLANIFYVSNGFNATGCSYTVVAFLTQVSELPGILAATPMKFTAEQMSGDRTVHYYMNWWGTKSDSERWQDKLAKILQPFSNRSQFTLGLENDIRSDYRTDLANMFPRARPFYSSELLEICRSIKDDDEIANVRKAARIGLAGMHKAISSIHTRSTEINVVLAAKIEMHECWAERYPKDEAAGIGKQEDGGVCEAFQCWVLSGDRVFREIASPTNHTPKNEIVAIKIVVAINGYRAMLLRSLCLGAAPSLHRHTHADLLEIHTIIVSMIKPRVAFDTVYNDACRLLIDRGYETPPHVGHLIGLESREGGVLNGTTKTRLRSGMLVALMVEICMPWETRVQRCDTILVTDGGCEVLTGIGE